MLVGGSALYTRAVLDRFEFPGTDPDPCGPRLEAELDALGSGALHERLRTVDPEAAERIIPANGRRVVRALEVVEITGRPYSATLPEQRYVYPAAVQVGVRIPRPVLDERITLRVRRMWDAGLVDEVRRLADAGLAGGPDGEPGARLRAGARVPRRGVHRGEAFERTVTGTRRFARRQDSWFGKDPRIGWVDWDDPDRADRAVAACRALPRHGVKRGAGGSPGRSLGRQADEQSGQLHGRTQGHGPRTGAEAGVLDEIADFHRWDRAWVSPWGRGPRPGPGASVQRSRRRAGVGLRVVRQTGRPAPAGWR